MTQEAEGGEGLGQHIKYKLSLVNYKDLQERIYALVKRLQRRTFLPRMLSFLFTLPSSIELSTSLTSQTSIHTRWPANTRVGEQQKEDYLLKNTKRLFLFSLSFAEGYRPSSRRYNSPIFSDLCSWQIKKIYIFLNPCCLNIHTKKRMLWCVQDS